jgi:hypothetical protein
MLSEEKIRSDEDKIPPAVDLDKENHSDVIDITPIDDKL